MKRKTFYSFHFDNDVMRVQQVRQMGVIEGNEPVKPNDWEEVKRKGETSIKNWINDTMATKDCVIVLIGSETHSRPWVNYEIKRAWESGKALFGIHIHNLKCPNGGTCAKGKSPLSAFSFKSGDKLVTPSVYDPPAVGAYAYIHENMSKWVEAAIAQRKGS